MNLSTASTEGDKTAKSILSSLLRYPGIALSFRSFDNIYSKILKEGSLSEYDKTIPPFLFRSAPFPLNSLPIPFQSILNQTKADNFNRYVQIYFDDYDAVQFVKTYFPQHLHGYKSLIPGAFRIDILRLLLLLRYGGIYNDIGHRYLKPIQSVVTGDDEFISVCTPDFHIYNAFIAAYRNHPLIRAFLVHIMSKVNRREYSNNALNITGPFALSDAFRAFTNATVPFNKVEISGCKYKFLSFDHNRSCIYDIDGSQYILTKFPLPIHLKILYSNVKHIHYGKLWEDGKVYHQQYQHYEDFTIYFILALLLLIVFFYYKFGRATHCGACGISIGLVRDSLRGNNKRGWSILEPIISLYTIERSIKFVQYIYFKITTNGRTFHLLVSILNIVSMSIT